MLSNKHDSHIKSYFSSYKSPFKMRKPGTRSRRDGYNAGVKLKYILCLIIICCGIGGLSAQEPARDQASSEESSLLKAAAEFPTPEEVEARKKQTLESREIEEPTKKALIDLYDKILPQLSTLEKHQKEIDRYKKQKEQSPQLLSDIQKQLAQPVAEPKLDAEANLSLAQVENQKAQIEAEHKALVTQAMELEAEPKRRADRRAILPKEIAGAKERLEKLRSVPPKSLPDEKPSVFQARELLYRITEKVLGDEIQLYDAEMASYEARAELLTARRELISRNVSASEKLLNAWQNMATRRARMEAEKVSQEALKAQKEAIFSHPLIKQLAKDNVTLTNLLTGPDGLPARIEGLNRNLKVIEDELANRGNEYKSVKERVETIGHSGTIGLYLLTRKNGLPDVNQNKRNLKERIKLISATQYELLKHEDDWAELIGLDDEVDALSLKLESELNESQRESIRVEARKYLQTKRDNLKSIIEFYNTYFNKLIDLDVSEARLVALIEQYDRFVSEYIFWVKSSPELSRESFKNIPASLNWLGSPKNWLGTGKKLMQDFMDIFYVYVLVLLLLLLMLIKRNHFKKNLFDMSELLHQKYSDSYSYTQKALALTMLLAIVRPGLFLFISWRLTAVAGSDSFTTAVAMGCFSFSILFLGLEIVMCFMAPAGLVQAHFSVPSEAVRFLRWHTRWLLLLVLPLYFVLVSLMSQSEEIWQNSMGRLAFILIMLVVATYLFIIFRPAGLFIQKTLNDEKSWIYRLRYLWYLMAGGLPLILILLAMMGFFYTARELAKSFVITVVFVFVILVVKAMFERWLVLSRTKTAIRQAKERLAEGETHENTTAESDANVDFNFETMELTAQVKRVLQTILGLVLCIGFWMIWNDVFPAIKGFQRIELWTTTINNEIQTIFLANLITAIIILFLMMVLGHNLPGLLDLAVLEQLRFDKGGRFAIKTTMRYIIYVVGTVMAFGEIGIGWGKVQWLVGAMLVGLGFGLQEIFANFVSGLLILFEQPIRVDDIVTVDNTSGKVTKIRIRATTIRDWDRKEYIVPNKEFITGRLLNWTLSDKLNRIVIKVGIAYGSNVELALSELNRVVREHPLTMDDPEPVITFEEFGESSLNLVVRCFLPNLDDRLKTITELHKGIDNAFRAANIEIAFPQQDIHIRSIKGKLNVDPLAGQHPDPPGLLP